MTNHSNFDILDELLAPLDTHEFDDALSDNQEPNPPKTSSASPKPNHPNTPSNKNVQSLMDIHLDPRSFQPNHLPLPTSTHKPTSKPPSPQGILHHPNPADHHTKSFVDKNNTAFTTTSIPPLMKLIFDKTFQHPPRTRHHPLTSVAPSAHPRLSKVPPQPSRVRPLMAAPILDPHRPECAGASFDSIYNVCPLDRRQRRIVRDFVHIFTSDEEAYVTRT